MFRLENWHVCVEFDGVIMGYGECFDNPRFYNGYYIHTSPVLSIEAGEEDIRLHTRSGSCYVAEYKDIAEDYLQCIKAVFQKFGIPFDEERYLKLIHQKEEETKNMLSGVLSPGGLYVEMVGGWAINKAYFKTQEEVIIEIPVTEHPSVFTSGSILVTDWAGGLCDWRIYPYGESAKPYHWSDGLQSVSIKNIGKDFVFKGSDRDILCEHGKITTIKSEEYRGEGLFSPDAVNGKNVFS